MVAFRNSELGPTGVGILQEPLNFSCGASHTAKSVGHIAPAPPESRSPLKLLQSMLGRSGSHQQKPRGLPRQIMPAVHNAMLMASLEHRGGVRRAAGLERIPQTIQCYRGHADLGLLGEARF
jgi:hypothetical protein